MGVGGSKLSTEEKEKGQRKCASYIKSLEACRKANASDPKGVAIVCRPLELSLVLCYGEEFCKEETKDHRKCYTAIYKRGFYNGFGHCKTYEDALKAALKKKKLFPV